MPAFDTYIESGGLAIIRLQPGERMLPARLKLLSSFIIFLIIIKMKLKLLSAFTLLAMTEC